MFFILLTFATALFIEGLGSLVSVLGISKLFGPAPIIIALAVALDVGKVVTVSLLYSHWKQLSRWMKAYALLAAAITMTITSVGAAGYLSGAFQTAVVGTKESDLKVSVLKEQQVKYQQRKKQIDDQIANLPPNTTVNQRLRLIRSFRSEQQALDAKIAAIDKELPTLQLKQIGVEAKAGPIIYVAKALDIPVEEAAKWVILLIIFVFDPLAIFLIVAGNFLWARRKENLKSNIREKDDKLSDGLAGMEPMKWPPSEPLDPAYDARSYDDLGARSSDFDPAYDRRDRIFEYLHPSSKHEAPPAGSKPEAASEEPPRPTYVPSGVLSPIHVGAEDSDEYPEQLVHSSLSSVEPDPATVIDAHPSTEASRTQALKMMKRKIDDV